jgi:hypothetical protein
MKALLRMFCWMVLAALVAGPAFAAALGTGFTYQGQLILSGSPVNGTANLRFSLWDAAGSGSPPVGGNQIGSSQVLANVPVAGGMFVALLNDTGAFGPSAFKGDARWLQIEVCADPACTARTVLAPRQPVTPAPYASYSAGPWQTVGSNLTYSGGLVGVGTTTPQAKLHVVGGDLLAGLAGEEWIFHTRSAFGGDFLHITDLNGGVPQFQHGLILTQAGRVGIGTTAPTAALEVRGDVKLGSSGQYYSPGGAENLRIIRGSIGVNGEIVAGSGFQVSHTQTGRYQVTFDSPFAGLPSVSATAHYSIFLVTTLPNTGGVVIDLWFDSSLESASFDFIAIGPR